MRKPFLVVIFSVIVGLLWPVHAQADFVVPAGFVDQPVVGGVPAPTAIDWLPSGELLIATQGGILFSWNGAGAAQPVLDLSADVCAGNEMGLLGLAVDPAFASGQRLIFLYYTHRGEEADGCTAANRANRVSRFTVDDSGDVGSELVLIDNIAAPGGNHNAGDLQFGGNELLYISVGDGGSTPDTARRLDTLNAKILRIDRNGGIPPDNPFQGSETEPCALDGRSESELTCQEIYATGLRNPFRIAFDADDVSGERFFINDVGAQTWEEIDEGAPEADYGWNIREGPCVRGSTTNCAQPSGFDEPIHAYQHQTGCRTITGGAFIPNSANWPAQFDDDYLFADRACATIFALNTANGTAAPFATGSGAIHLRFGSDGALYYTTYEGGGVVRRIIAGTSPQPPVTDTKDKCKKKDKKHKDRKGKDKKQKGKKGKDKKDGCKKGKRNRNRR